MNKLTTMARCLAVPAIVSMTAMTLAVSSSHAQNRSADLALVAEGFTSPVALAEAPDGSGRLFVVDQTGQIWIVTEDGARLDDPFLTLADSLVELNPHYDERGLLGLAFHPEFATNGRFYVYYSIPLRDTAIDNFNHTNRLSEFKVSATDMNRAEPDSEKVLLEIDWPYMNHNAGTLAFGPDSMLYVSLGDGGNRDDQDRDLIPGHVEDWYDRNGGGNAQDIENNLLGSILRIDVGKGEGHGHGAGSPYTVPEDNPFTDIPGVPGEQWAYGFRNPWRMSFDMGGNGELIVGDAGQNMFEEVSVVSKGGNYGWNVYEGTHCFNAASPTNPFNSCPDVVGEGHPLEGDPLIGPVIELMNSSTFEEEGAGLVLIGGYVYRGNSLPSEFGGDYFFGVWSQGEEETAEGEVHFPGKIYVAEPQDAGMWPWEELEIANADSFPYFILSFGQDVEGDVYVLTTDEVGPSGQTGKVYRIVAEGSGDVGLVSSAQEETLPRQLKLEQNYPNPFNPSTSIRFRTGTAEHVRLAVYDVLGRRLSILYDGAVAPGEHTVTWDGRDAAGTEVSSGTYVYRIESDTQSDSKIMTLLR